MKFFQGKKPGFYVTLAAIGLSVVTAIVYALLYASTRYMSWEAFGILMGGAVLAAALLVLKLERFAPVVLLASTVIGCMFYVYDIYFFISSVMVGIQFSGFPPEFFVNIAFFVAAIALSVAAIFVPQDDLCKGGDE